MSNIFDRLLERIPPEKKRMMDISFDISYLLFETLKKRNISKEKFAKVNNLSNDDINSWLSGVHQFSLKEIISLEKFLNLEILSINLGSLLFQDINDIK